MLDTALIIAVQQRAGASVHDVQGMIGVHGSLMQYGKVAQADEIERRLRVFAATGKLDVTRLKTERVGA